MLRSWALLLGTLTVVVGLTAPVAAEPAPERDVIAQMFGWNWRSIGRECGRTLGPLGYGAVQTSPPEEHSLLPELGFPWWQSYSAVSYGLTSRYGTRAELAGMVRDCHAAGVRVYVDTIINNMSAIQGCGIGSGATPYCHYEYPAVPYGPDDFHHCGTPNDAIENYSDRYQTHHCQTLNASDLATENDRVRDRIAGYLNDLLSLGIDGFRVDSAKYIAPEDLSAIEARLSRPAYVYQEVVYSWNEQVRPEEYLATGDVMDLRYAGTLSAIFRHGHLAQLRDFGSALPSAGSVVFVANHDTERNGSTLTYADPERYTLANAFLLAWTYGHPKVLSDYAFDAYDEPSPSDPLGRTTDAVCGDGHWLCEHAWPGIGGMVGFHQRVRDEPVVDWTDDSGDLIAFGRGSAGYIVLNGSDSPATRSYRTSLPPGRYCDVMHGLPSAGTCTGPIVEIDESGWLHADLAPRAGLALHTGAMVTD
ncbi:alpha-amylase [Nocardia pseudobrasiliensis]|uniref:Alpha-amylase n=1 Tax=Nocardia pseudobrasiliensis TaxID=45979 RepID=A0A370I7K6_9NOCA|nr:alpha-amylase family protein [Nocardia pseudobrasiliensis]RDI66716.1 alpha-amylase [Nocardia pseudobrasiliensis]